MNYVSKILIATATIIFGTVWFVYMNDLHAAEWNEKPVICEQKEVFEKLMVEQNKILLGTGDLLATVRTPDGYSDTPAILPMRVYINPTTNEWTIAEYHKGYNSVCVIGFGANWHLLGNKI